MRIFDYQDYRTFLADELQLLPRKGYGQAARIAKALGINPSIVTLVLKGEKHFTLEQAGDLAEYLALSDLESDYLLILVSYSRAAKENLRRKLQRQLEKIRTQATDLKALIPPAKEMAENAKAIFYSQWYYSAVRILTSIDEFGTPDRLAARLGLSKAKVKQVLEFLVQSGLCLEENGKFQIGPQSTHIGANSPLVARHHINWRERSVFRADSIQGDELFFTSPVSIAKSDIPKVRQILVSCIEEVFKVVDPSACEEAACLNIDWFRF